MKNIIEKSNKTKFDYTCRKLGLIGLFIIGLTIILGGSQILILIKSNNELTKSIAQVEQNNEEKNKTKYEIVLND